MTDTLWLFESRSECGKEAGGLAASYDPMIKSQGQWQRTANGRGALVGDYALDDTARPDNRNLGRHDHKARITAAEHAKIR